MIPLPLNSSSSMGYDLLVADKLFRLGARPPVVRALCHLGNKTAIRLYKTIHQQSPKQGMLPYDPFWIVRSAVNNIHASIFLGLIHDFSEPQHPSALTAEMLISAYELYCQVVTHNPSQREAGINSAILLNINRAWHLAGQLTSREMGLVRCAKCQARFVKINKMPKPFQQCPICEVWADRTGRCRWMTVNAN